MLCGVSVHVTRNFISKAMRFLCEILLCLAKTLDMQIAQEH